MSTISTTKKVPMIAGVIFALGWPLVLSLAMPHQDLRDITQDVVVLVAEWGAVIVLAAIVLFWEREAFFSTVGLTRPKPRDWWMFGILALLAAGFSVFLVSAHVTVPVKNTILAQVVGVPVALRIALVFTAGVCEEILFRGYAIERLNVLTGNIWTGAVLATLFFTLGHVGRYGFSRGLLGVAMIGAVLSLIYVWRRNLLVCIGLHWLIDAASLIIIRAFVTLK